MKTIEHFRISSHFTPSGDQPESIRSLVHGIENGEKNQVLLGVTGSGKTFTIANVIEKIQKPSIILAPNKILAAQLYGEMKEFFPHNAVEYFVSYYDYYQPEAYVARTDTFIEKTSSINEQIDRMRHAATRALIERRDTIIVASISCIYGIGGIETYSQMTIPLKINQTINREHFIKQLVALQYKRNDLNFNRGSFRVRGDVIEVFPVHYEDRAWRLSFFGDEIEYIIEIDALTGEKCCNLDRVTVFANNHYVTPGPTIQQAIKKIQVEMSQRIKEFESSQKFLEAQRIQQRTQFDIEMLTSTGMCQGIENYSRYLTGRNSGEPPPTLFEYFPKDALLIVDESHVAIPQIRGMYNGDRARKTTLSDYGFRLPSCLDNRPLKFEEWDAIRPQTIFVSATPGPWELEQTEGVFVDQVIRPTGIVDPICEIHPCTHQVDDLIHECQQVVAKNMRILVTTLTKKMAEALTEYLNDAKLKVRYLHSDIDTLERIQIIQDLRLGNFDILVGINLLREGLDIPECGLVAILDADKEGFLRSKTSLIQTIGRAARNIHSKAILYADVVTGSMKEALDETERRRAKQHKYNKAHNIKPTAIKKDIKDIVNKEEKKIKSYNSLEKNITFKNIQDLQKQIKKTENLMLNEASNLNFEKAAELRDKLKELQSLELNFF